MFRKVRKAWFYLKLNVYWHMFPARATYIYARFLIDNGATLVGLPNYLSAKIWFDGADYSKIKLGRDVTISSNVRILTHDWSLYTVAKAFGCKPSEPIGIHRSVTVGDYSFIGTGSILLPGAEIGVGVLVGAGSVVRGKVPDYSIVVGNPAVVIGNTKNFVEKHTKTLI